MLNILHDISYQLESNFYCIKKNGAPLIANALKSDKVVQCNENFLLQETICSIIDVLSHTKLKAGQVIELKSGIIPNEVNEDYNKFKVMLYTILEKLIVTTQSSSDPNHLTSSDTYKETQFFLDFNRVSDSVPKKYVFSLMVKKVSFTENEEEIIRLINESKCSTTLTSFYTLIKSKDTESIK